MRRRRERVVTEVVNTVWLVFFFLLVVGLSGVGLESMVLVCAMLNYTYCH